MLERRLRRVWLSLLVAVPVLTVGLASPAWAAPDVAVTLPGMTHGGMAVDAARSRVYVSVGNTVQVIGFDGGVIATVSGLPAAGGIVVDGDSVYVAVSGAGRIERIDPVTFARTDTLATGLVNPRALVKAGGRLWTTHCHQSDRQLAAVDPSTFELSLYPAPDYSCPWLVGSAADPNAMIAWNIGISPATMLRLHAGAGAPKVVASGGENLGNLRDVSFSPDGTRVFPASGAPYRIDEYRSSDLRLSGVVYPAEPYPSSSATTAARGGLLAVGVQAADSVYIYTIGNPAQRHYKGNPGGPVLPRGLAFSPDGTRLFAITGDGYSTNATFRVLDVTGTGPPPESPTTTVAPAGDGGGPVPPGRAFASLSTTSVDFGEQRVGTFGEAAFMTVRNAGSADLSFTNARIVGPQPYDFDGATDCFAGPLTPHASCTVGLSFEPTRHGVRSASLRLDHNGGANAAGVALVGRGTLGYVMGQARGALVGFGDADLSGRVPTALNRPVVGMGATPNGDGVWLVAGDGGIFSFGDAAFFGSTGAMRLNQPIVGIATTPTGEGYWLVASDGGIFAFGDAGFFGSTGAMRLNQPVVGMAATPTGRGYWLVASDGGMFSFGDARFFGSTGSIRLNRPVVGMTPTPSGLGYWLVATDGGMFSFGDAGFFGSTGAIALNRPIVGMAATPRGQGYWIVASDGGVFGFGDAPFLGSLGGSGVDDVVGLVGTAPPVDLSDVPEVAATSSQRKLTPL